MPFKQPRLTAHVAMCQLPKILIEIIITSSTAIQTSMKVTLSKLIAKKLSDLKITLFL